MPKKKVAKKVAAPKVKENYSFTLEDWNRYKAAGTNTGIVKDFPQWLDEQ